MTGQIKGNYIYKQVNAEAALTEVTDMFLYFGMEDNPYMQNVQRIFVTLQNVYLLTCLVSANPATINEESITLLLMT